jgi:hypothetical protein
MMQIVLASRCVIEREGRGLCFKQKHVNCFVECSLPQHAELPPTSQVPRFQEAVEDQPRIERGFEEAAVIQRCWTATALWAAHTQSLHPAEAQQNDFHSL